jgi:hypothetical protein
MTKSEDPKKDRFWTHGVSIACQQLLFALLASLKIMLLHVSAWVSSVPILILWAMYWVAPLVYARPVSTYSVLRSYSTSGWFFVAGAITWGISYWIFSDRYGVPVSWDEIEEQYFRGSR